MENLTLFMILAPLSILWSIFITSSNAMFSLISLLTMSLVLPLLFMETFKMFWPCGLLLILMSTGLIVIFAYIVSLHSSEVKSPTFVSWLILSSIIFMSGLLNIVPMSKIFHSDSGISVDIPLTFILIFLLLFLVVSFIRNVYSKGGGFRKKY